MKVNEWEGLTAFIAELYQREDEILAQFEINGSDSLELAYLHRSFSKPILRVIESLITRYNKTPAQLAALCDAKYALKWEKLAETYFFEYEPLANTDVETTTTDTTSEEYEDTETRNLAGHSEQSGSQGGTSAQSRYAYNSSTQPVPNTQASDSAQNSSEADTTDTGTVGNEGTKTITYTHTEHRVGNIGVTTTAQLIDAQRQLYINLFIDSFLSDIDEFLTVGAYDD